MPKRRKLKGRLLGNEKGNKYKVPTRYACPTPKSECSGSRSGNTSAGIRYSVTVHGDQDSCKKCWIRYMVSIGYVKDGNTLISPNDGPRVMIPKKVGSPLRPGKYGRSMPKDGKRGVVI